MPSDLSQKLAYPHTLGVYLAVNAVPDAYLVMDGPGCAFYRAMTVHGRHDWASTLLSCDGRHRVQYAGVDANTIASDYEGRLREAVRGVASAPEPGVVLLGSMPICTLAGTQHERILREEKGDKPGAVVPGRSLGGDWLDGYEDALCALAASMDFSGAKPGSRSVAVVGHLMDRCEGDQSGNAAELRRLCRGLGLDPVTVWLSGESYAGLREVRRARAVISLPHGRRAAAWLARRLKAGLVETGLPVGLEATQAWLRKVAKALGRERTAEAFIRSELERVVPRFEWAVPASFLGRKAVFAGDPHLHEGLAGLCEDLGIRLEAAFLNGKGGSRGEGVISQPSVECMKAEWERLAAGGVDLLIGNSDALAVLKPGCAWVELGYPSVRTHFLREEPTLGFEGFAHLADRMANALGRATLLET
jgi:nitrogenase molybdenum-iron protein alpha/beta subunit